MEHTRRPLLYFCTNECTELAFTDKETMTKRCQLTHCSKVHWHHNCYSTILMYNESVLVSIFILLCYQLQSGILFRVSNEMQVIPVTFATSLLKKRRVGSFATLLREVVTCAMLRNITSEPRFPQC